jgi:hypothetical protein
VESPRLSKWRGPRILVAGLIAASVAVSGLGLAGAALAANSTPSTVKPVSDATTPAWVNGKTVTVQYPQNFFCDSSVASGASSGCEIGTPATKGPTGQKVFSVLYVLVPFFTPTKDLNLHCPEVGSCVNHPMTIDLSAIGASADSSLPAHSHILDGPAGGWWEVEVVGVTSQAAWDQLAAGKSLATLRAVQAAGNATGDVPTNLYLFFNVVR